MTFVPSNRSRVLFGATHLSGFLTEAGEEYTADVSETTVLLDTAKTHIAITDDGSASLDGIFDGTPASIHAALSPLKGLHEPRPYSYAPRGFGLGEPVELAHLLNTAYQINSAVAGIVAVTAAGQATGGVNSGVALHDLTAETETGDGQAHDHGASTAEGAVAHLHVTGVSGSDPELDVIVEHSADGDVWVTLATFAQATEPGAQRQTVTGTVNRHLRASWTVDGTEPSFAFAVAIARR